MSQENVELVRSAFGVVTIPGDPDAMIAASHPGFEMRLIGVGGEPVYYAGIFALVSTKGDKEEVLRAKLLIGTMTVALCGVLALSGIANARSTATTTVTIKYNGDGFQGKVKSSKAKCVKNRKVNVFKKNGQKLFGDTSDSQGNWDTGNSGQASGSFYAHTNSVPGCKAGTSKTIHT